MILAICFVDYPGGIEVFKNDVFASIYLYYVNVVLYNFLVAFLNYWVPLALRHAA